MSIEIAPDVAKRVQAALAAYVQEHYDHEIGDLQSQLLMEFVVSLIGATVYNRAITDAQAYLQGKLLDLEGDLHEVVEWGV